MPQRPLEADEILTPDGVRVYAKPGVDLAPVVWVLATAPLLAAGLAAMTGLAVAATGVELASRLLRGRPGPAAPVTVSWTRVEIYWSDR